MNEMMSEAALEREVRRRDAAIYFGAATEIPVRKVDAIGSRVCCDFAQCCGRGEREYHPRADSPLPSCMPHLRYSPQSNRPIEFIVLI